jgi:hypothetical protein
MKKLILITAILALSIFGCKKKDETQAPFEAPVPATDAKSPAPEGPQQQQGPASGKAAENDTSGKQLGDKSEKSGSDQITNDDQRILRLIRSFGFEKLALGGIRNEDYSKFAQRIQPPAKARDYWSGDSLLSGIECRRQLKKIETANANQKFMLEHLDRIKMCSHWYSIPSLSFKDGYGFQGSRFSFQTADLVDLLEISLLMDGNNRIRSSELKIFNPASMSLRNETIMMLPDGDRIKSKRTGFAAEDKFSNENTWVSKAKNFKYSNSISGKRETGQLIGKIAESLTLIEIRDGVTRTIEANQETSSGSGHGDPATKSCRLSVTESPKNEKVTKVLETCFSPLEYESRL